MIFEVDCSTCDQNKAEFYCLNNACECRFACNGCGKNRLRHRHQQDLNPISNLLHLINKKPEVKSNNPQIQQYCSQVREACVKLSEKIDRMAQEHCKDLLNKSNGSSNNSEDIGISLASKQLIQKIKNNHQQISSKQLTSLINQLKSLRNNSEYSSYSSPSSSSQFATQQNFLISCLKQNFMSCYKRIQLAIDSFVPSYRFDSLKAKELMSKGDEARHKKIYHQALREYKKSRDSNPHNAEVHYLIGLHQDVLNKIERGKTNYQRCLFLNPKHYGALNNLGVFELQKNQPKQAVKYFQKCLQLKQDDADVYSNLSKAYRSLGDYEKASYFEQIGRAQSSYSNSQSLNSMSHHNNSSYSNKSSSHNNFNNYSNKNMNNSQSYSFKGSQYDNNKSSSLNPFLRRTNNNR